VLLLVLLCGTVANDLAVLPQVERLISSWPLSITYKKAESHHSKYISSNA